MRKHMKAAAVLIFFVKSNNINRSFHIGLFATCEEAESVKEHYRKEIQGFKDYDCKAEITEVPVIGSENMDMEPQRVYRFQGWNVNEDLDEIDIWESDCYVSREQAQADYEKAQIKMSREEWTLNRHVIGQCDWQEGFIRIKQ